MSYQMEGRVRYSEIDENRRLTLPGLVNYFQDCSTLQSEELGVGLRVMEEKGKAWLLLSWNIVMQRLPELGERVFVQTWPYKFRGFSGDRNFRMLDARGETLASAASQWIYMDVKKGRPGKIDEDILAAYTLEEPLALPEMPRKLPVLPGSLRQAAFHVMRSHLDTNHHVNNGQYILMAQEYLPPQFTVRRLQVEYRKSARLHDEIVPLVSVQEKVCTVGLCAGDESPYAVVRFLGD